VAPARPGHSAALACLAQRSRPRTETPAIAGVFWQSTLALHPLSPRHALKPWPQTAPHSATTRRSVSRARAAITAQMHPASNAGPAVQICTPPRTPSGARPSLGLCGRLTSRPASTSLVFHPAACTRTPSSPVRLHPCHHAPFEQGHGCMEIIKMVVGNRLGHATMPIDTFPLSLILSATARRRPGKMVHRPYFHGTTFPDTRAPSQGKYQSQGYATATHPTPCSAPNRG
jgi:hypothetical protein